MRKLATIGLIWVTIVACMGQVQAISAQSAVVLDATTGRVLFAQQADVQLPMASTTKIMTALVALEYDLDRTYTVQREYTLVEGSSMYLKEGERITLRDTLYGLMLQSGNDAALAIAGECGGLDDFVAQMNAKARELGLYQTHFDNPNGLDGDTHYTTARELAVLTAYALQNEDFREIVSTQTYISGEGTENERVMTNHNKFLWQYESAIGVKTGYTSQSGRCLVTAAEQDGRTLVAVTLNAPDDWNDHATMLDTAFALYETSQVHTALAPMDTLSVQGGTQSQVLAITAQACTISMTAKEQNWLKAEVQLPDFVYAPVVQGQKIGEVVYTIQGAEVARTDLLAQTSVAQLPPTLTWWEQLCAKILAFFGG